jgi:hypothetical protein
MDLGGAGAVSAGRKVLQSGLDHCEEARTAGCDWGDELCTLYRDALRRYESRHAEHAAGTHPRVVWRRR